MIISQSCENDRFSIIAFLYKLSLFKTVLYIINRKIHGCFEIPDLFLVLNMLSHLFAGSLVRYHVQHSLFINYNTSYPGAMCCSMACAAFVWAAWINLNYTKYFNTDNGLQ